MGISLQQCFYLSIPLPSSLSKINKSVFLKKREKKCHSLMDNDEAKETIILILYLVVFNWL